MGLEIYIGVADCHGIESFQLKKHTSSHDRTCRILRAAANGQRHAIYYEASVETEAVRLVEEYLQHGEHADALSCLKRVAIEFSTLPEHQDIVHKIPDPSLDPYA